MTIRQLGEQLRSGRTSCLQLIEQAIASAREQRHVNAFITLTDSEARAAAIHLDDELKAGNDRGPLHGIPIALKDLFYTRGVRTTAGSPLFADFVPDTDAAVVEQLRAAGAISIGKTNLHELAFGITSKNPHYGAVLNPLDQTRLPGGSSGGSAAAVAAGMVPMALGTDTGGSIRIPASFCGICGLKPTYERISRRGILPLAFSLDHAGPLGTSIEDCAIVMNALASDAEEFNLPCLTDLQQVRVAFPSPFFLKRVDPKVKANIEAAVLMLERAGARIIQVSLPDFDAINIVSRVVQLAEFASLHAQDADREKFGSDVSSLLEQGRMIAGHEYVNAQRLRTLFRRQMDQVWREIDVLITPTTPTTAPLADNDWTEINGVRENVRMATTRLVRGINYLGEPALSMPCGVDEKGLPVGLQMISAPSTEAKLLQIAKSLERMLERQA